MFEVLLEGKIMKTKLKSLVSKPLENLHAVNYFHTYERVVCILFSLTHTQLKLFILNKHIGVFVITVSCGRII